MNRMVHDCTLCHLGENSDQKIILGNDTVLFLQNEKEQGALLGSGVIIPVRHAETVFDLTQEEVYETFELLKQVKSWMDNRYHPDGYNVGWNCVSTGTLCGLWHTLLVKATRKSVVVKRTIPTIVAEPFALNGLAWNEQAVKRYRYDM